MSQAAISVGDVARIEEHVDLLFKGVKDGGTDTEFKRNCENRDGKIAGQGPNCTTDEEIGLTEQALCWFDFTLECMNTYISDWEPPCMTWESMIARNVVCGQCLIDMYDAWVKYKKCLDGEKSSDEGPQIGGVAEQCECKQCNEKLYYGFCGEDPCPIPEQEPSDRETEDDSTENEDRTPDTGENQDPLKLRTVKTTSAYTVIPRLYGRYVTQGNIIWLGNQVEEAISYTKTLDGGGTVPVDDIVTKVDFAIALCVGPLDSILRIWIDDRMIFNATLPLDENGDVALDSFSTGATDIDFSSLADSDYEMARLQAFKPTIQLFTGTAGQKVSKIIAQDADVGFGRAPAHRGIAYVMFRDVDLRLFGNAFPQFRFDVISDPPEDALANVESAVEVVDTDYLEVDAPTGSVFTRNGDDIIVRDIDNFTETYTATLTDLDQFILLKSGHILASDTNGDLFSINPWKDLVRYEYGGVDGPDARGAVAFVAYTDLRIPYDVAIIPQTTGAFTIHTFDYNLDTGEADVGSGAALASYELNDAVMTGVDGILHYYQFMLKTGSQDDMTVRDWTMTSLTMQLDTTPAVVDTVIDNAIWGSDVAGVVLDKVVRDPNDNGFILFFNTGFITKLDIDLGVVWTVESLYPWAPFSVHGDARSGAGTLTFTYVALAGELLSIRLSDGEITVLDDVVGRGLPAPAGAQYFDSKTNSVAYISADDTLVRVFPGKIIPARMPISTIIDRLIVETRADPSKIDTSGIDTVTVDGYYIDSKTTVRDTANKLGDLYQFGIEDNGEQLVFRREADVSAITDIDDDDLIVNTVHVEKTINDEKLDALSVRFVNIDDTGLIEVIQMASLKPDEELSPGVEEFTLDLNDRAEFVRPFLEQALRLRIAARKTFQAVLMPRHLALTPRDRLRYNDEVFRIREQDIDIGETARVVAHWFDPDVVNEPVSLEAYLSYIQQNFSRPTKKYPYRPHVLFMNAVNDDDQARVWGENNVQVVYTAVDAPNRAELEESTQVSYRMYAKEPETPGDPADLFDFTPGEGNNVLVFNEPESIGASPTYHGQVHREGAHIGRLVTAPVERTSYFTTDQVSELVIKFDHPDTVDYFTTFADKYEVPENPRSNLLIVGREMIQFFDWSVAMDGVTVTFTTLYRGRFGTEPYMSTHVEGEHCFLYTAETIKPTVCNPLYTKRQQTAKVFITRPSFAGVQVIDWGKRADAGSARPYGPSPAIYRVFTSETDFKMMRRRSVQIDPMVGGMQPSMPSEWTQDITGGRIYIEAFLPTKPTIEDFETQYVRFQGATDVGDLFEDGDIAGSDFADETETWVLVVENQGDIWGHPTIVRVPGSVGGAGACDAFEAYDLGYADGCPDGVADFGGVFQGPNYEVNRGTSADPACYPSDAIYSTQYDTGYDDGYVDGFFSGTCP